MVDSVEGTGDVEVVLVDEVEKLVSPCRIGVAEVDEMTGVVVSSEETSDTTPTVVTDASSLGIGVVVEVEGAGVLTEVETVVGFIVVVVVVMVLVVLVEVDVVLFMDVSNSFQVTRHFSNWSKVTSFVIASICK